MPPPVIRSIVYSSLASDRPLLKIIWSVLVGSVLVLNQRSMENGASGNCRLLLSGTLMNPLPSKLNAWPTSPGPNVAVPCGVPLLPPSTSFAFPFPGHQLIIPPGADAQERHLPALPAV